MHAPKQSHELSPSDIRYSLLANGYKPIPVNGKRPQIKGWQQLSPTRASIDAWERGHSDHANTGILTGEVVAIDVDAPDPTVAEKLIAELLKLPGAMQAPCRTGRAPKCLFIFRASEPRKKVATPVYLINGKKCQIEVLGSGQQFVAYGIHPETEKPYTWASGDPMSVPFNDLPLIATDHIDGYLAAAEAILAELGEPERKPATATARPTAGDTFWNRVNTAALDNTDAWVPMLFSSAKKETGTGAWRVSSASLGRGLQEDISIHSSGIQDFGEERGLTAIDLVQKYSVHDTPKDAAFALCQQLGREPNDFGWETTTPVSLKFGEQAAKVVTAANDDAVKVRTTLNLRDWTSSIYASEPPPVEYLVDGVIEKGIPGLIAAMGEVGKSYLMLELARRVAFGSSRFASPIFGGQVVQEGTAVFLTGEDDRNALHRRMHAIDPEQARLTDRNERLIAVPLPSAAPSIQPFWAEKKGELIETDAWFRLKEQLLSFSDLRLVVLDPLQLLALLPLNEDPAAGQFVCASIASLAAESGANVFFTHHMNKGAKSISNLADAREAVRGTTAIVDGVRVAYGLWYGDEQKSKQICKQIGIPFTFNRIAYGGVLKANGAAKRILTTYSRNPSGLLVDANSKLGGDFVDQDDLRTALVIAIEAAAASGQPFTKTGQGGLFENRERLPEDLRGLSKHKMADLTDAALDKGEIVRAMARGDKTPKWLDVPGGQFAIGLGEFRAGATRKAVPN
jgi:hypothetical protein